MIAGYFGPPGTFTHEALLLATAGIEELRIVPIATIHHAVIAVRDGEVERSMVPIENSIEGAVNATLDTLAVEASGVSILAELVLPDQPVSDRAVGAARTRDRGRRLAPPGDRRSAAITCAPGCPER